MRTSNPALNAKTFEGIDYTARKAEAMTIDGAINKTGILLLLVFGGAAWTWHLFMSSRGVAAVAPWMLAGLLGGFIIALITIFKATVAPVTAPIYAVLEGFFLGGLSAILEKAYPGIVIPAVGLTFGTMFCMLLIYRARIIAVTDKFRAGIVAATGAVFVVYLTSLALGIFGVRVPYIHEGGAIGIGFSLVVIVIAALNLVLDFDFIERGARAAAPKYMEWYGAFGLIVTLVWLYIEILRLLTKLRGRD